MRLVCARLAWVLKDDRHEDDKDGHRGKEESDGGARVDGLAEDDAAEDGRPERADCEEEQRGGRPSLEECNRQAH